MERKNDEQWGELANAIIVQAVVDYETALRKLKKDKGNKDVSHAILQLRRQKADCIRFFRSGWFKTLTALDGETIMHRVEKRAEEKYRRRWKRNGE